MRSRPTLPAVFTKARQIEEVLDHPLLTLLRKVNPVHNSFDLWGENLTVRQLATHISTLPANRPIALVMVQCFSGAIIDMALSRRAQAGVPCPPVDRVCGSTGTRPVAKQAAPAQ